MKDRIMQLMQDKGLNRNEFAEKIGVQRSNITHILEGRNRPSLDFIEKLAKAYPGLNMNWLVKGEGRMFKKSEQVSLFPVETTTNSVPVHVEVSNGENIENTVNSGYIIENKNKESISYVENTGNIERTHRDVEIYSESPSIPSQSSGSAQEKIRQNDDAIEKIILFYKDKTFDSYNTR